jgi:hypothetical protein
VINPRKRLGFERGAKEIKEHPFFASINWDDVMKKKTIPPFLENILMSPMSHFDPVTTEGKSTSNIGMLGHA